MLKERSTEKRYTTTISDAAQQALREKYEKAYKPSEPAVTIEVALIAATQRSAASICSSLDMLRQGRSTEMNNVSSCGHMVLTVTAKGREGACIFVDLFRS